MHSGGDLAMSEAGSAGRFPLMLTENSADPSPDAPSWGNIVRRAILDLRISASNPGRKDVVYEKCYLTH